VTTTAPTAAGHRATGPLTTRWGAPVGLSVVWIVLAFNNPRFLSAINLTNLALQIVAVGTIAIGVVLVLLLGEIDLSVGAVSGLGSAVVVLLSNRPGSSAMIAILVGLGVGAFVGATHGLLVARIGIPSLVVTLAGLLSWQGAQQFVLGDTGTVNVTDPTLVALAGSFVPGWVGWLLASVVLLTTSLVLVRRWLARQRSLGSYLPLALSVLAVVVAVAVFNQDRGVPSAVLLFLGLLMMFDVIVRRTRLGRHAVAIGSDATAARRAGIPVGRVAVTMFVLASMLAVVGGLLAASRLLAVNQFSGSTDLMLGAIAAAVIGGTSLFGGRGSVWSALLGALVVGSVANGLDLLGVSSAARSVVTGLVLAVAVGLDTVSRRVADGAG
jgi:D-xylose transport system permease protein